MERLLKIVSFGSIGLLILILIAATLLEGIYGSAFAINNIYHSLWFVAIWATLATTAMIYIMQHSRRAALILLHASLVAILIGAFLSFITSKNGNITLSQEGLPASMYTTTDGELEKLPFRLQLTCIDIIHSNGSSSICDYRAYIVADDKKETTTHIASLNNPIKIRGYQFCIKGVSNGILSLTVSHDTIGRPISYAGYLMVFLSFIMLFLDKESGWHTILRLLKNERGKKKVYKKGNKKEEEDITYRRLSYQLGTLALPPTLFLLCVLWLKRGIFPGANGVEVLLLLAIVVAILSFVIKFNNKFILLRRTLLILASIIAAIAIKNFEWNYEIQPILRTPLLGVHVTTIIIAYALLACTAINALIALCTKESKKRALQALLGRALLYPATMLLACGIFIGAIWANISWGRYWGWDPKEVWALITLLICSISFHTHSLRFMARPLVFHLFCIIAFAAVLFTYFGVNYLLGGLHSYM